MDSKHEGSRALSNAIIAVTVFSWLEIIVGTIITLVTLLDNPIIGILVLGFGICGLILRGILKGFYSVVVAAEFHTPDYGENK